MIHPFGLISCCAVVALLLISCDNTDSNLAIVESALRASNEIAIDGIVRGGSVLTISDTTRYTYDDAYGIVQIYSRDKYLLYKYQFLGRSSFQVRVPSDAVTLDITIIRPHREKPEAGVHLLVKNSAGIPVAGALPAVMPYAHNYASAHYFARYELTTHNSSEGYFMLYEGAKKGNLPTGGILQTVDSCSKLNSNCMEIHLALQAYDGLLTSSSKAIHRVQQYLNYVIAHSAIKYPEIFCRLIRVPTFARTLKNPTVSKSLFTVFDKLTRWKYIEQLSRNINADSLRPDFLLFIRGYLGSIKSLSAYGIVSSTPLIGTLGNIARDAGDYATSSSLYQFLIDNVEPAYSKYHSVDTDPFYMVDVRNWVQYSLVERSKILLELDSSSIAIDLIARYRPTMISPIYSDTTAFRLMLSHRKQLNRRNIDEFLSTCDSLTSKPALRSSVIAIHAGRHDVQEKPSLILVISSSSCSICRDLMYQLSSNPSISRSAGAGLLLYNVDNGSVEWSMLKGNPIVSKEFLVRWSRESRAYPTVFTFKDGKFLERYEAASYDVVIKLLSGHVTS